ncbi:MAG: hypothetical protein ACK4OF_03915 [Aquificaceae bacterium]
MRRLALLSVLLGALSLSVPLDLTLAKEKSEKQVVQGKAKKKSKAKLKPRYAQNINRPEEGELLKLEGMVRDLNEQ